LIIKKARCQHGNMGRKSIRQRRGARYAGHPQNPICFTASKNALAFLLRQLTDIKNEVPNEDGIRDRESVELWKIEDSREINPAWSAHLDRLIERLVSEQEA